MGLAGAWKFFLTEKSKGPPPAGGGGLFPRVFPADGLLTAANELAERIAANPPNAVRMTKRLLREAMHTRLDTLLEMAAAFQSLSHQTDDHRRAVTAFLSKHG